MTCSHIPWLSTIHTQAQRGNPTDEASDIKQKRRQQTEDAVRKTEHLEQGRRLWDIRTVTETYMHVRFTMYILEYVRTSSYYVMWSKEGMRTHKLGNCNTATQAHVQNKYEAYFLTYSMVQSPSWEANWFAASREIPRISRNPKVHYRTHKRPPPVPILGQPNPVHIKTKLINRLNAQFRGQYPKSNTHCEETLQGIL